MKMESRVWFIEYCELSPPYTTNKQQQKKEGRKKKKKNKQARGDAAPHSPEDLSAST